MNSTVNKTTMMVVVEEREDRLLNIKRRINSTQRKVRMIKEEAVSNTLANKVVVVNTLRKVNIINKLKKKLKKWMIM